MADRRCEQCKGTIPNRMSRTRNDKGQLVCEECQGMNTPDWTTHSSLTPIEAREMTRRQAEALVSVKRISRLRTVAHDSGDNAIINHCPFCGSGAVIGGSDGTVTCDFCHSPFTVQVQPAHPFMPQTIDGQPAQVPGMPGDVPTEISAPLDPSSEETEEGVAPDALGDSDPDQIQPPTPPAAPGAPKPPAPGGDKPKGGGQPPWLKNKKSSAEGKVTSTYLCEECGHYRNNEGCVYCETKAADEGGRKGPSFLDYLMQGLLPSGATASRTYTTEDGHTLDERAYMARLALSMADDREPVLDAVRMAHTAAGLWITCWACDGTGEDPSGEECETCKGTGTVEAPNQPKGS